jgi:hypothetical protein
MILSNEIMIHGRFGRTWEKLTVGYFSAFFGSLREILEIIWQDTTSLNWMPVKQKSHFP